MDSPRSIRRRRDNDPLAHFRRYLGELEDAVLARDSLRITSLLRKRTATHMPREVREELLAISRMSRESLRAPIRFLRFQHRMTQLAAGGEQLLTAQTELRLESRQGSGEIRRRDDEDQRTAAAKPKPAKGSMTPDDGDAAR
ncbi:MAG TPA: hypothetical protein VGM67_15675 [Gemmatimonadaceae bacterium]|jgi:hypothetical protein